MKKIIISFVMLLVFIVGLLCFGNQINGKADGSTIPSSSTTGNELTNTEICRIGTVKYDTLQDAIDAAANGGVIYLLKSFESNSVIINKNISIVIDDSVRSDITIYKTTDSCLFSLSGNINITGKETANLLIDGSSLEQSTGLVEIISGTANFRYVHFINCHSGTSSAISIDLGYNYGNFYNCEFTNNISTSVASCINSNGYLTLSNCILSNNISYNGTIYQSTGDSNFISTIFRNNSAIWGGALNIDGNTQVLGCTFEQNSASYGGAIYYQGELNQTLLIDNYSSTHSIFTENEAIFGGDIYLNKATLQIKNIVHTGDIYQNDGTTIFDSCNSNISTFVKKSGSIVFKGRLVSSINFKLVGSNETSLFTTNFLITDEDLTDFTIAGYRFVIDGYNVMAAVEQYIVTIITTNDTTTAKVNFGEKYVLPQHLHADFLGWQIGDSLHNAGDIIEVNSDITIIAKYVEYYTVKIVDGDTENSYSVKDGDSFVIPENDTIDFICWQIGNVDYTPLDTIIVTSNLTIIAKYMEYLTITILDGTEETSESIASGYVFAFPQNSNENFVGWVIGDLVFKPGDSITITSNITIVAKYELYCIITIVDSDKQSILTVKKGDVYTFSNNTSPTFVCWMVGDIPYKIGDQISVEDDIIISAKYDSYNTVVIVDGDSISSRSVMTNSMYVFGSNSKENFLYWIVNDTIHYPGDIITVTSDLVVTAVYEVYYTITIEDKGIVIIEKVKEGTLFSFPNNDNDGFICWIYNEQEYNIGENLSVYSDMLLVSRYEVFYTITIKNNDLEETIYVKNNSLYILENVDDYKFECWVIDSVEYQVGEPIIITNNITIVAKYGVYHKVVYVDEEVETSEEVKDGSSIILPNIENLKFVGWKYNGDLYYPNETIVIEQEMRFVASYDKTLVLITIIDNFDQRTEIHSLYATYVLPVNISENFEGWKLNNQMYKGNEQIIVTGDITIEAVYDYSKTKDSSTIPTEIIIPIGIVAFILLVSIGVVIIKKR